MELREYGRILGRRWRVIALLVGLVLVLSLVFHQAPPTVYRASMRFSVGIEGTQPVAAASGEGRSDAWLASIVISLIGVVLIFVVQELADRFFDTAMLSGF